MIDRQRLAYLENRLKDLGSRFEWLEMQIPMMQKKIEYLESCLTEEIQTSSYETSNEPNESEIPTNSKTEPFDKDTNVRSKEPQIIACLIIEDDA